MSWRLWLPYRVFPQVPVIALGSSLQIALFVLFFVIAVALLFKPLNSFLLLGFMITEIITLLGDEMRWMPWAYQFLFILLAILINKKNPRFAINSIILILSSSYLFSGLQKINGNFLYYIWQRLIMIRFFRLPPAVYRNRTMYWAGLSIPLFEIASAILILLPKQRKIFALFPIFIHVFIILFLSPIGIDYNYSVVPWNVAMAIFIYILFVKAPVVFSFSETFYKGNVAITLIWTVLPFAGLFGYWDKFLSSGVYSGNVPYMIIYLPDTSVIPSELKPYVAHSKYGYHGLHQFINLHEWGMKELQVAIPPEPRIYKEVGQLFKEKYTDLQPVCVVSER